MESGFLLLFFFETLHFFLKPSVFLKNYSTALQKKVVPVGSGRGKSGTISLVGLFLGNHFQSYFVLEIERVLKPYASCQKFNFQKKRNSNFLFTCVN